ncbi:MAG: permease, partial [Anaerolineales bacterium]
VYVSENEEQTEKVQRRWAELAQDIPLVIIDSPYRELIHPLVSYIEEIAQQRQATEVITVVVPEFVPIRWWQNLLHMQNATWLRYALRNLSGVVVVDVPYQVE